jgi:hypothetical protein
MKLYILLYITSAHVFYRMCLDDPYRDDPVWNPAYATAVDVQGSLGKLCSMFVSGM